MTPRVLVVEDDPDIRSWFRIVLEFEGFEVVLVDRITDALATARAGPAFDLIVTDLHLPDGSADTMLATLRDQRRPRVPVLLVSGTVEPRDDGWRASGVTRFVSKPLSHDDLIQAVRGAMAEAEPDGPPRAALA